MVLFLAGPYSAETVDEVQQNVNFAMDAGLVLMEMGHDPVVPHLSHYMDAHGRKCGFAFGYRRWMRYTKAVLSRCDGLVFLGSSPGANEELELAQTLGKPVYWSVLEVPNAR